MGLTVTGTVRNLLRGEPSLSTFSGPEERDQLIAFRIERTDDKGDILDYTQVELRGKLISGDVADGDRVELELRRSKDGIVRATWLKNLTTNSEVRVSNQPGLKAARVLVPLVVLGTFIGGIAFVVYMVAASN